MQKLNEGIKYLIYFFNILYMIMAHKQNTSDHKNHMNGQTQKNRMGKHKRNRPRTINFKLNKFKDKQKILRNARNLKDTGIFIYEDFCDDTMELRWSLW